MADVLVVDSGELGELLAALLGQYGMDASRARSGEEALERALVERPKVAIIEHELPDAPGVDVADLLRAELSTKVILTYAQALVAEGNDELLARIGKMDASFARPFRSLTLVEAAAQLLGVELHTPSSTAPVQRPLSSTEGAALVDDPSDELLLDVEVTPPRGVPQGGFDDDDEGFDGVIVTGRTPGLKAEGPAPPLQQRIDEQRVHQERAFAPGSLSDLWQRVQERRRAPSPQDRAPTRGLDGREAPMTPRTLADMLDAFHQSQTTGELWLQSGRARRVLLIRRGVIVGARSNIEAEDLSVLALRRGVLTPEQIQRVRREVIDGKQRTVVDAILALALLPEQSLHALVEEYTRRVAVGAFTWQSGNMKVALEGRAARETMPVRVPVGDVVVRGILLTEGEEALKAAAPDDARFSPAADSGYGLEDLTLSHDEARAVIAMDGTKTVRDLILLFEPTPSARTIRGLAAGLLCLNLVRFVGWGPAEARRISFF